MKFPDDEFVKVVEQEPTLPKHTRALELLQMVYRGEFKASPQQLRAAIESLPYENPKLTAVAVGHLTGEDFYNRLERAINRTNVKLIEGRAVQVDEDN
jgi:hypothetical protein